MVDVLVRASVNPGPRYGTVWLAATWLLILLQLPLTVVCNVVGELRVRTANKSIPTYNPSQLDDH